jgi:RNA polymerase sigma-70 factor (ECF subfamily)
MTSATAISCIRSQAPSPRAEVAPDVVRAAQRGERWAFEAFVRHYQTSVFAFLSRVMGPGRDVEDLAQEVFLRACRALPRFELRAEACVSTWLLSIAVRLVQDERRRRRPVVVPLEEGYAIRDTRQPELDPERRELLRRYQAAVLRLTHDHRTVLVLAEFHDLNLQEIAELVECPQNTVKTRLHRARARLREFLCEELGEVTL